jgi:hypothetical protein
MTGWRGDFFRAVTGAGGQSGGMTKGLGLWLLGYGVFLFICGAAGFLINPNQAPTPLLAGTLTGGLMAVFGVLSFKGVKWVAKTAMMITIVFTMFSIAIAMQQWMLVYSGKPELPAAAIATVLFGGSALALWALRTKA